MFMIVMSRTAGRPMLMAAMSRTGGEPMFMMVVIRTGVNSSVLLNLFYLDIMNHIHHSLQPQVLLNSIYLVKLTGTCSTLRLPFLQLRHLSSSFDFEAVAVRN